MFSPNSHLHEFVQTVPVCSETAVLATVLATLQQQGSECLVLLDQQQYPIGLVRLSRLLPYLSASRAKKVKSSVFSTPLLQLKPSVVEPLTLLAGAMPLGQWFLHLQRAPGSYGLLDATGQFMGVLDQARVLQVLAESATHYLAPRHLETRKRPEPSLPTQIAEVPVQASLSAWISASDTALSPLLELLDRLPLPLMLQTSHGRVIRQNLAWQQQVHALLDPVGMWQAAAPLLQHPEGETPNPLSAHPANPAQPEARSRLSAVEEPGISALGTCQIGVQPNTCICICPLKTGQEQVVQLLKIAIGTLMPNLKPSNAGLDWERTGQATFAQPNSTADQTPSETFRLAALLPDAAPPSHQSETLWLVLAQDITEQQQLARELTAKNADLIQLNRLKDEFLACISHELRTPLTAVLGLSSLLKDQTLGALNPRQVHYAQLIYQSGRHLMAVVNDILDLTRMETGQLELVPDALDVSSVCQRALEQAKQLRSLDDKSPEAELMPKFSLEIEPEIDFLVADELRLRQMLVHLLSNAIKFTESDQQIGLKVGRWGGWIAFTVWDTGMGIPTDKQHLIFQKFQQLENPLTRRFEGTGLGLVLTQRLARLHGGDVTFISKEGQGSQFTILLPPQPPGKSPFTNSDAVPERSNGVGSHQRSRQNSSSALGSRNRLVLIVEAVPQYIETLSQQLSGLGYRVVIARSGTEALEKARRLQPCSIFLNPLLPLLSGWDVLTLLKSNPETRQIPVVITSTKVDEEQSRRCHANGWLSLPVQLKALQQMLRQVEVVAKAPAPPSSPAKTLTVLRLSPGDWSATAHPIPVTDLNHLLHSHHYRVLEADDLDQAELLARVWKPNVALLDGTLVNAAAYFEQLSQHGCLAALPLVILEPEAAQAANQVPGLLVFPCLSTPDAKPSIGAAAEIAALLQVIQVAAGYGWRPAILALEPTTLAAGGAAIAASTTALGDAPQETEWLQALTQYLQTAGFRSAVGRNWLEALQQIESESIDLLLLCWTETTPLPETLQNLATLQRLNPKLPILVLDHRPQLNETPSGAIVPLPAVVEALATQILPPTLPMTDLLDQIHQAIEHRSNLS